MSGEPYDAQTIRWLHYQTANQLQEYDQFLKNVDEGPTRELIEDVLADRVQLLDELERHWREHPRYTDLPTLYGTEGGTEEEHETFDTKADSATEEEPTPDEALEGMRLQAKDVTGLPGRNEIVALQNAWRPPEERLGEKAEKMLQDAQHQAAMIDRITEAIRGLVS